MSIRSVGLTGALIFLLSPAWARATADEGGPYYYYLFDSKETLTLDLERVALLDDSDSGAEFQLQRFGIMERNLMRWPIRGWWLAEAPLSRRTPPGIEALISQMASNSAATFVSPVFVGSDGGPLIVTPEILVGFHESVPEAEAEAILSDSRTGTILERRWARMDGVYRLRIGAKSGFQVLAAANALAERPEVRFAEPDMIFTGRGSGLPNDPGFPNCWGIHNTGQFGGTRDLDMDGPEAWGVTMGDASIVVLIIDAGVEQSHPDLNQVPGTDSTSEGPGDGSPLNSCDNHGTPVAGCVSAIVNNSLGTVGIAPECRSASARTFISCVPCNGSWTSQSSWTVDSLAWGEANGVRVTNNSNAYGFISSAVTQKYEDTRIAGMVHFASAGNDGLSFVNYPASIPAVNAIAALLPDGQLTSFSNYGTGLAFAGPGLSIYTTDRTGADGYESGDYVSLSGTSFACPYTAGVAALLLSDDPSLDADDVESIMQCTSVDLGSAGYDTFFGWGLPNAHRAFVLECQNFRRSDSNGDGSVDVGDGIFLIQYLFNPPSQSPDCFDAADSNDDGALDISDIIYSVTFLFLQGPPPPPPYPGCAIDDTVDGMACDSYSSC